MIEILILFLILFGVGACLGLCYVAIKAIIMTVKGVRFAAKDMKRIHKESWEKAKADHAAAQAAKQAR